MDIGVMRGRLRQDLHDEDASAYRWSDEELDRHIERSVREFSLAIPLEASAALTATPGSRDLSIASLTGLVAIEAVEYPTEDYPPTLARYSVWEDTLTLLVDSPPADAADVVVYYTKLHTLDGSSSTIPPRFEDVVAAGAAGYAALEWASFATNRINAGGNDVWREYLAWGRERLTEFQRAIARHGRRNAVRPRRLYTPATGGAGQSGVEGP